MPGQGTLCGLFRKDVVIPDAWLNRVDSNKMIEQKEHALAMVAVGLFDVARMFAFLQVLDHKGNLLDRARFGKAFKLRPQALVYRQLKREYRSIFLIKSDPYRHRCRPSKRSCSLAIFVKNSSVPYRTNKQ
jgi:hypothetical protein